MNLIMDKLTIFAVIKVKDALALPLHFAESREMAENLYSKALDRFCKPNIAIQLVSFWVDKDSLYDFIVGEDDEEKGKYLFNAFCNFHSIIKSSTD
ncbi:hypothetical protein AAE02nite_31970 [Adhaeribacter aerolatus]|uniref:Uncharacterized protein n=2 Tax=Adhaeribacter aerolatus TaxID=670289 RepID=A0A512B0P3_9BACT|nr:hypothetical protein AAE02nite_31970 [Adhaeribacter aerolatus]